MKAYYHTPESVKEYIALAAEVNGQEHINQLKHYLKSGSSLLELGSGPGKDWAILNEDYRVTGSDYSQEFIKHLENTYPQETFLQLDASTLEVASTFQAIYSNKVLHHLTDKQLEKSFQLQHKTLGEKGIICHTFWKGEGDETFKGMYVNYHTEEEVKALVEPLFDILVLESYAEFDKGDSFILIARKKRA